MDDLEPSFRGLSESFEQGYAGTQERLVKPEVPAADGLKRSVNTQFVCHKPVMPSFHGILTGPVFRIRIIRMNDPIQDTGDQFCGILLELYQQIRQHAVEFSASRIITPAPGDPEPFRDAAFVPEDTFAVITVTQMALFAGWANIITALS
jgi:hypothetical protein